MSYAIKRYQTNLRIHETPLRMMSDDERASRLKQRLKARLESRYATLSPVQCNIIRENDENTD